MNIKDSLVENSSIQLNKTVNNWEEAIRLLMKPLLANGSINSNYPEAIISRTKEIGPFYILGPGLAMPHERTECGAIKDAFSLLTLSEKVEFPNGELVDVLIGFSATSSDVHVSEAIPQIVALFDEEDSVEKVSSIISEKELLEYIDKKIN